MKSGITKSRLVGTTVNVGIRVGTPLPFICANVLVPMLWLDLHLSMQRVGVHCSRQLLKMSPVLTAVHCTMIGLLTSLNVTMINMQTFRQLVRSQDWSCCLVQNGSTKHLPNVMLGWATKKVCLGRMGDTGLVASHREREQAKERTGLYQYDPNSDDGNWIGVVNRGSIQVQKTNRQENRTLTGAKGSKDGLGSVERGLQSFSIPYASFDHGWDFTPTNDGIVLTGHEESHPRNKNACFDQSISGKRRV